MQPAPSAARRALCRRTVQSTPRRREKRPTPSRREKCPPPSRRQQAVFMLSAVQAVSQLHTGGFSVLPSAKAAVGIRHSSIHRASRVLTICFFILSPSLFAVRWQHHTNYINYRVNRSNCQVLFSGESIVKPKINAPRDPSKRPNLILWDDLLFPFGWYN